MSQLTRFPVLDYAPRPVRALLAGRGVWALSDQALLSLGNFLTNILLIRHLSPDGFGNFAVLFSVILFLNNLHASLVTYPLSVTAGADDDATLARRTRGALAIALLLGLPFGLVAGVAAACVHSAALVPWVVAAMLLWQIQETLRRAMMARLQHHRAIPGDALSYLGQVVAIVVLIHFDSLSVAHAFGVIAGTSGAAALLQAIQLKLNRIQPVHLSHAAAAPEAPAAEPAIPEPATLGQQWTQYWDLGRWVLMSNLIGLVTVYATPWILRYVHGAKEVAAYQALANLLGVTNPIVTSVAGLIVPAVAKARVTQGIAAARRAAANYGLQGLALLLPYYLLLLAIPATLLRLFYGKSSPYLQFTTPLRVVVVIYALGYLSQVMFGFLNGMGRSRWSFYAQSISAAANAAICLPLAVTSGMVGAIWGGLAPLTLQAWAAAVLAWRVRPEEPAPHRRGFEVQEVLQSAARSGAA